MRLRRASPAPPHWGLWGILFACCSWSKNTLWEAFRTKTQCLPSLWACTVWRLARNRGNNTPHWSFSSWTSSNPPLGTPDLGPPERWGLRPPNLQKPRKNCPPLLECAYQKAANKNRLPGTERESHIHFSGNWRKITPERLESRDLLEKCVGESPDTLLRHWRGGARPLKALNAWWTCFRPE